MNRALYKGVPKSAIIYSMNNGFELIIFISYVVELEISAVGYHVDTWLTKELYSWEWMVVEIMWYAQ